MSDALRMLVAQESGKRRIALLDGSKLVEYIEEDEQAASLVNAVLLGRVERVLPGMKAAFVQIGRKLNGFLPLQEGASFAANAKPLTSGSEILVQVKKDEKGDKGAFLSQDIALPGQFLIYMPCNRYVGVSKRVTDAQTRERLVELGKAVSGGACGVVMREAAVGAPIDELTREWQSLADQWQDIAARAAYLKAPSVLCRDESAVESLLRDYAPRRELSIDSAAMLPTEMVGNAPYRPLDDEALALQWKSFRVEEQLAEALGRTAPLQNGGTLVIDEREALTTIDVNSAHFVGAKGSDVALEQNLQACDEIVRQIRLRNLSGILLIDFIDMETDEQRKQVKAALQDALANDRVKTVVHEFTELGLLEMTRKRMGASLRDQLTTPCAACRATGRQRERNAKQ